MDIKDISLQKLAPVEIADILRNAGDSLKGKNLRKASWLEIAEFVAAAGPGPSVVWQRLQSASTREDAIRVLRIVRKYAKKKSTRSARISRARRKQLQPLVEDNSEFEVDEYWNYRNPWNGAQCWCCDDPMESEDLLSFEAKRVLDKLRHQNSTELIPAKDPLVDFNSDGISNGEFVPETERPPLPLEVRLAEYLRFYSFRWDDPDYESKMTTLLTHPGLEQQITHSLRDPRDLKVILSTAKVSPELSVLLCVFSPFWIRLPHTWDHKESIVQHLFVRHSTPKYLYREWKGFYFGPRIKWLVWLILLGQGASLQRAAKHFGWRVPGKFQRQLDRVPENVTPLEATVFAEILRHGGNERDFRRILGRGRLAIDRTELPERTAHGAHFHSFWDETVRWFISNGDAMTDDEANQLLIWGNHEFAEWERQRRNNDQIAAFSWKGRTVAAALRRALEFRERTAAHGRDTNNLQALTEQWTARGWNTEFQTSETSRWSFIELVSGQELHEEGAALKHCVFSYTYRCVDGYSAIFSLRHNDERCLTVEITPATRIVEQARGIRNRDCTEMERTVLKIWLRNTVRAGEIA